MKTKLAFLTAASLLAAPAFAEIQINGFANLIGGMTLDDDEAVYDYDSDFTFDPASVFGLQVRGDVSDKLSEGDVIKVKVLEIDRQGRIRLSMKAVEAAA